MVIVSICARLVWCQIPGPLLCCLRYKVVDIKWILTLTSSSALATGLATKPGTYFRGDASVYHDDTEYDRFITRLHRRTCSADSKRYTAMLNVDDFANDQQLRCVRHGVTTVLCWGISHDDSLGPKLTTVLLHNCSNVILRIWIYLSIKPQCTSSWVRYKIEYRSVLWRYENGV